MAIIIKTSSTLDNDALILTEKIYENPHFSDGSLVYIWTSETSNGDGLAARGFIQSVEQSSSRSPRLSVLRFGSRPKRPLTKAMLLPYRNGPTESDEEADLPIIGIAHKLYYQAHNKIAELSAEEARFLDSFFEAERARA